MADTGKPISSPVAAIAQQWTRLIPNSSRRAKVDARRLAIDTGPGWSRAILCERSAGRITIVRVFDEVVTPDGERTLNTHLGACLHYAKAHVPEEDIRRSKVFFTTGYVWDTPSQIDAVNQALQVAKNNNVKVAFDVADPFVVQRWGAQLREVLEASAHVVFANALEAQMLVGVQGEDAARILGQKIEIVVVKDGAKGAWVAHRGDVIHIPTHKVNVVDTTGAGDMFAGGFLYGLTHGCTLETCGRLGTLLAADTITHMGVRLSHDTALRAKALLSHGS